MSSAEKAAGTPGQSVRDRLLHAAERLVARKGFAGVGVQEIAREAGLTTGAIYSNFSSKAELLMAVADRLAAGYQLEMDAIEASSFEDFLARSGRQIAAAVAERPDEGLLTFEFALMAIRDPELRERALQGRRHDAGAARLAAVAEGFGQELPLPPEQFHTVMNVVASGLALYRLMYGEEAVSDDLFAWLHSRLA